MTLVRRVVPTALTASLLLCGCASQSAVTFRVTGAPTERDPVRLAYVQVVPLAMSPVPLPVSLETLEESAAAGSSGLTDAAGKVTLAVPPDRACDVTVSAPTPGVGVWRGRLDARGRLTPISGVEAETALRVETPSKGRNATP